MKAIYKFLVSGLTLALVVVYLVKADQFSLSGTAYAVGDLTIDWGVPAGNPIFTIPHMAPGQSEPRDVLVTNNAASAKPIGVRGTQTSIESPLGSVLYIAITADGTDLYGGTSSTGTKTLADFFADSSSPDGIPLLTLASGQSRTLTFIVTFAPESSDDLQGESLTLDITIGVAVTMPAACGDIDFSSGEIIFGTEGGDSLRGTPGNDLIFGLGGGDSLRGQGGDDCLLGGDGGDSLEGGAGNDVLVGEAASDNLEGGNGDDQLFGSSGGDGLEGGNGNDELFGEEGSDGLRGGNGDDTLIGGAGSDGARGEAGTDTCEAESERTCEL